MREYFVSSEQLHKEQNRIKNEVPSNNTEAHSEIFTLIRPLRLYSHNRGGGGRWRQGN